MHRLRGEARAAVGWITSLDGGLLTEDAWRRRHLVVCVFATVNGVVSIVASATRTDEVRFFVFSALLVAALGAAWIRPLGRRPRELAVVVALVLCAVLQNRYIGNLSSLAAAYILLLAVYQDWLPLAAGLAGTLILPALAIFYPSALEHWKSFQREEPTAGAWQRFGGVVVAIGVAVLVWRANGVAARDAETGLATRALVERRLAHALRDGRAAVVLVCDVDAFRLVADDLPRAQVTALIRAAGHRLREVVPPRDGIVAASEGAKYIVLMQDELDEPAATQLGRRLCAAVAEEPFSIGDAAVPLTISVGISLAQPGDDPHDLISDADAAMRRAKWGGATPVKVAQGPARHVHSELDEPITAELRRALESDELVMYYQPLVALDTGAVLGAEALVRWQHRSRGLLPPGLFMPVTEMHPWLNAGVSRKIAAMVLQQTARWDQDLPGRLPHGISVNVAPTRLKDPALRDELRALLAQMGVPPERIVVELTEGALMDLGIDAAEALSQLAEIGVRIALDDFGTGHSSLAHLRDFPLHEIKVDQSFTALITDSKPDRAVVRAVLAIAREFGADVVVEGVELEEQREALLAMNGDDVIGQGYLFSRPLPADDFTRLVQAQKGVGMYRSGRPGSL